MYIHIRVGKKYVCSTTNQLLNHHGCYVVTKNSVFYFDTFGRAATWDPCRAASDVEGRRLEGVDDVILSHAGQILLIKEGAMEACGVNLCQDHLETIKYTHVSFSVAIISLVMLREWTLNPLDETPTIAPLFPLISDPA